MAETRIAERTAREGASVQQIRKDVFRVNLSGTPWTVNIATGVCMCPDHQKGHNRNCKHRQTARAVAAIPARLGASIAVDRVVELAARIFARNLSLVDSYRTLNDAMYSPHVTRELRQAAIKRHGVRLARQAA